MKYAWTYDNWEGEHFVIGGDEWYRRTLVLRLPFTTRAVVIVTSRIGKLYSPLFPDPNFERWRRAYRK